MAHYDEQYEEREKHDAERRKEYEDARNKLMGLPQNQMIKMLFSAYLDFVYCFSAFRLMND